MKIYRQSDGTLTDSPSGVEYDLVGEIHADCGCDYITEMVQLNINEGRCDPKWTIIEKQIKRRGI